MNVYCLSFQSYFVNVSTYLVQSVRAQGLVISSSNCLEAMQATLQCPVSFTDFTQKVIQLTVANRFERTAAFRVEALFLYLRDLLVMNAC